MERDKVRDAYLLFYQEGNKRGYCFALPTINKSSLYHFYYTTIGEYYPRKRLTLKFIMEMLSLLAPHYDKIEVELPQKEATIEEFSRVFLSDLLKTDEVKFVLINLKDGSRSYYNS